MESVDLESINSNTHIKNLEEKLNDYYASRFEKITLDEYPGYTKFIDETMSEFLKITEDISDENLHSIKTFRILETDIDNNMINDFSKYSLKLAEKLYGFNEYQMRINNISLMANGGASPIKVDLEIDCLNEKLKKTMYIKPFDKERLFGLELYNLLGGINKDYNYVFNSQVIVEDKIEGKHEDQIMNIDDIRKKDQYKIERIKLDMLSYYLGIDDLIEKDNTLEYEIVGKEEMRYDNYLVTEDGRITIIDFNVMNFSFNEEYKTYLKNKTIDELNISEEQYDTIYNDQKKLLKDRFRDERPYLNKLLGIIYDLGLANPKNVTSKITELLTESV